MLLILAWAGRDEAAVAVEEEVSPLSLSGGGMPRRDTLVTWYPSRSARRQMHCPRNPVPPRTNNFPLPELLVADDMDSLQCICGCLAIISDEWTPCRVDRNEKPWQCLVSRETPSKDIVIASGMENRSVVFIVDVVV
jgi:hypothetical protein